MPAPKQQERIETMSAERLARVETRVEHVEIGVRDLNGKVQKLSDDNAAQHMANLAASNAGMQLLHERINRQQRASTAWVVSTAGVIILLLLGITGYLITNPVMLHPAVERSGT